MTRKESIGGWPLSVGDQLVLFSRTRETSLPLLVNASIYDPKTDQTETESVLSFTTTNSAFGQQTNFSTFAFRPGTILVGVVVTSTTSTNPVSTWAAVEIFRNNRSVGFLCGGFLTPSNAPSWVAGGVTRNDPPFADASVDGAVWSYAVDIENGAMNSGAHQVDIVPGTSSRFKAAFGKIRNDDGAARSTTIAIENGDATPIDYVFTTVSLNAAANLQFPWLGGVPAAAGNNPDIKEMPWIAGLNGFRAAVAAVAVSEDTEMAFTGPLKGVAPTITETAPCGATITIITERVESG